MQKALHHYEAELKTARESMDDDLR